MGDEALKGGGQEQVLEVGVPVWCLVREGPVDRLVDGLGHEMVERPRLEQQDVVTALVLRSAAMAGL